MPFCDFSKSKSEADRMIQYAPAGLFFKKAIFVGLFCSCLLFG